MSELKYVSLDQAIDNVQHNIPTFILIAMDQDTTLAEIMAADRYLMVDPTEPEEPKPEPVPKPKKKASKKTEQIDHGKIVALAKAGWSTAKIADEMGCSGQTVLNHLKKEGVGENEH